MKERALYYSAVQNKEQEKILSIKINGNKEEFSCLDRKHFENKEPFGYVRANNKDYSGKEFATLSGVSGKDLDIYAKKKFYERIVGYMETTEGKYLAVTQNLLGFWLLALLVIIAVIVIILCLALKPDNSVIPSGGKEVIEENEPEEKDKYRMIADVILPEGSVSFDGTVYAPQDEKQYLEDIEYKGQLYSGAAQAEVQIVTEDGSHTLLYKWETKISGGAMEATALDFPSLDFEVTPGTYDGTTDLIYDDGTEVEIPTKVIVRSSTGGSLGIGYSDQVTVDREEKTISLKYSLSNSPDDTRAEVIIMDGDKEYVIGQSGIVSSGQTLTALELKDSMSQRLEEGTYSGVIRIYVVNGQEATSDMDLHTDLQVTITVK